MLMTSKRDGLAGLFFVVVGLGFLVAAQNYSLGSASRMGPGYFPSLLAGLLILIGSIVGLRSLRSTVDADGAIQAPFSPRSAAIIIGSTLLFAAMLAYAGLIVAVIFLVFTSSAAVGRALHWQTFVLAVALAGFSAILFVTLLGLPVPVWPVS